MNTHRSSFERWLSHGELHHDTTGDEHEEGRDCWEGRELEGEKSAIDKWEEK